MRKIAFFLVCGLIMVSVLNCDDNPVDSKSGEVIIRTWEMYMEIEEGDTTFPAMGEAWTMTLNSDFSFTTVKGTSTYSGTWELSDGVLTLDYDDSNMENEEYESAITESEDTLRLTEESIGSDYVAFFERSEVQDTGDTGESALFGTWSKIMEILDGDTIFIEEAGYSQDLTFEQDNTWNSLMIIEIEGEGGMEDVVTGTWSTSGDSLTLTNDDDGSENSLHYDVTGDTLVFSVEGAGSTVFIREE